MYIYISEKEKQEDKIETFVPVPVKYCICDRYRI